MAELNASPGVSPLPPHDSSPELASSTSCPRLSLIEAHPLYHHYETNRSTTMARYSPTTSNRPLPNASFNESYEEECPDLPAGGSVDVNGHLLSNLDPETGRPEKQQDRNIRNSRSNGSSDSSIKLWWREILSMFLSIACLAINVGILAALNKKPYRSWHVGNAGITPNAIISIFAIFSKAGLLLPVAESIVQLKWLYFQARAQKVSDLQVFDDASRGPLGSLTLLWKVNIRVRRKRPSSISECFRGLT